MRLYEIENNSELNNEINQCIIDWVISSLSDFEKRKKIIDKLVNLEIPIEYKFVPSSIIYRFSEIDIQKEKIKVDNTPRSWSYIFSGAKKIQDFYIKDYGKTGKIYTTKIIKSAVVICIPTFYKITKIFPGKQFMNLVKSECELISYQKS